MVYDTTSSTGTNVLYLNTGRLVVRVVCSPVMINGNNDMIELPLLIVRARRSTCVRAKDTVVLAPPWRNKVIRLAIALSCRRR